MISDAEIVLDFLEKEKVGLFVLEKQMRLACVVLLHLHSHAKRANVRAMRPFFEDCSYLPID